MNNNIYISMQDGRLGAVRDRDADRLRKSEAAAGRRLVRTTCVRMVMKGRSEMSPEETFINGGTYLGMLPEVVEVLGTPEAIREVKERLLKSANPAAAQEWDAGRCRESDIVLAIGGEEFVKSGGVNFDPAEDEVDRDADGNVIVETFHKSSDDAPELLRRSYGEYMRAPGTDLKKATDELNELVRKMEEK